MARPTRVSFLNDGESIAEFQSQVLSELNFRSNLSRDPILEAAAEVMTHHVKSKAHEAVTEITTGWLRQLDVWVSWDAVGSGFVPEKPSATIELHFYCEDQFLASVPLKKALTDSAGPGDEKVIADSLRMVADQIETGSSA